MDCHLNNDCNPISSDIVDYVAEQFTGDETKTTNIIERRMRKLGLLGSKKASTSEGRDLQLSAGTFLHNFNFYFTHLNSSKVDTHGCVLTVTFKFLI